MAKQVAPLLLWQHRIQWKVLGHVIAAPASQARDPNSSGKRWAGTTIEAVLDLMMETVSFQSTSFVTKHVIQPL